MRDPQLLALMASPYVQNVLQRNGIEAVRAAGEKQQRIRDLLQECEQRRQERLAELNWQRRLKEKYLLADLERVPDFQSTPTETLGLLESADLTQLAGVA